MRRGVRAIVHGGAITVLAGLAYLWLAPAHVVDGDNAEMATLGALGGRAHPTGYPAYVLYLRATAWLPGASPAHTAALATALLATATLWLLHAACRAWGARPIAASIAVALYAASPIVLRMHTEAEVFAPNALVVAAILWLAAQRGPARGVLRVTALGVVAGLGLANHVTCVLLAPVGILGVVRGVREARSRALAIGAALGALAIGLAPYAYLFVADSPVSFGRVETFADLLDFVLRRDFGGPGAFATVGDPVPATTSLAGLAASLGRGWLYLPAIAALVVLGWRVWRTAATSESRAAWGLLGASFVLAGPVLVTRFNIAPEGLGRYVVERFHLLPLLLLAIPVASACDEVGSWLAPRLGDRVRAPLAATALVAVGFATLVLIALPRVRAVHSPAMELGVRNLVRALPARAVLVVGSDDLCFGGEYLQHALHERADVAIACWNVTSRDWYRARIAARGVPVVGAFSSLITRPQAEAILATGRPLFVENVPQPIVDALPSYPFATAMRILPAGEHPPDPHAVAALNRDLYAAFDLDYPRPGRDDDYAAVAHRRYTKTWAVISQALRQIGDAEGARAAHDVAAELQPEAP